MELWLEVVASFVVVDDVAAAAAAAVPVAAEVLIDAFEPENSDWREAAGVINCCRLVRFLN